MSDHALAGGALPGSQVPEPEKHEAPQRARWASRQERELAGLYETARDLAALRGLDEVLGAIVHRARVLMGADLTYIQVHNPETGDLRTQAVEGVVTKEFKTLRVPPNVGISRLVIRQRAPHWVRDFQGDASFVHDPEADVIMAREGVRGLLAAPLIAGTRANGVIYAGYRTERSFRPDEVALLAAFADHAAIALENARLFDESQAALAALRSAYATIQAQMASARHTDELHTAMTEVILRGGSAGNVADILIGSLGGGVMLLGRLNETLLERGSVPPGVQAEAAGPTGAAGPLVEAIARSRQTGRAVVAEEGTRSNCEVVAIVADGAYMGSIVHWGDQAMDPAQTATLERAGQVTALMTLIREARLDAEERVRGELLTEILADQSPSFSEDLSFRAHARKVTLADIRCVIVAHVEGGLSREVTRVLHDFARTAGGLAGEHLGQPTLLGTAPWSLPETAERVRDQLSRSLRRPTLVCVAPADATPAAARRAFTLASRCARLARAMGIADRGITTEQFGLYGMLFDPDRSDDLREFLQQTIGPVLRHDESAGTSLMRTLAAYFDSSGTQAKTARALKVHINTLLKRLERVGMLLGEDWTEPDRALQIQLAVRLHVLEKQL